MKGHLSLGLALSLAGVLGLSDAAAANNGFSALVGNVYAMDNDPVENRLVAYGRYANGRLRLFGSVRTGGVGGNDTINPLGDGFDPIGSQDPIVLSEDGRFLYLVNIGTHDISVFYLTRRGLPILIQRLPSGGFFPSSLAVDGDLLYALNSGGSGSIAGFRIGDDGRLTPIAESVRDLGLNFAETPVGNDRLLAPNDLVFDRLKQRLVMIYAGGGEETESPIPDIVPEVTTGEIWSWALDDQGLPAAEPVITVSTGLLPFAIDFTENGIGVVADAISGGVSSYAYTNGGAELVSISGNVTAPGQATSCWVRVTKTGLAFTTNSFSDSISSFRISRNGAVTLLDETAATGIGEPVDFDLSPDDQFMYVTTSSEGGVRALRVDQQTGELESIGTFPGLPSFPLTGVAPAGLVVR